MEFSETTEKVFNSQLVFVGCFTTGQHVLQDSREIQPTFSVFLTQRHGYGLSLASLASEKNTKQIKSVFLKPQTHKLV